MEKRVEAERLSDRTPVRDVVGLEALAAAQAEALAELRRSVGVRLLAWFGVVGYVIIEVADRVWGLARRVYYN